jgi:selenocysteine-specific elongation factor
MYHLSAISPFIQSIEIASLKEVRKVKSLQMFKKPVQSASQGDRIGMCVTQFDAKALERGIVCATGKIQSLSKKKTVGCCKF